ncbi:MAG: SPFH domain-containing protein [Planctomycetota bacterium]|nr:SPFH domain-containing protein [Planctomycetota bacterium]
MKKLVPIILAVVFVLAMLSYSMTYTVRFTEAAVVTTFGKASAESTITEPGMRFKAPYPIQSVTTYDTRMRLLQTRAEAQQTSDDKQIVIEAFLTWRVSDPLKFYERFSNSGNRAEDHFDAATSTLRSLLSGALSETGKYALSELFSSENASKLPELEGRILSALREPQGGGVSIADYGIEPASVGIYRVRLAEETTQAVNDRIAANRDRLAKAIEAQGEAEAEAIRAKAREDRDRILAFANRRAKEIEAEGDTAAAQYQRQMGKYPELAVFLKNLDLISASLSDRATVILSTDSPGLRLLDPQQVGVLTPGEIPDSGLPQSWRGTPKSEGTP